ncbi:LuxR family transcriptional regulator [Mycoavidus cysteinexigens]|uniref:LuxR family transcriptional regulator n=1 Tax=Mycoavidus cysteinexigens TaxID=1553431 RepID=A0A2Z6ETL0_9BURK|nr:two component system response regulator [Mycoavidus cysteinexigens]BBE08769.1 LuxR family transcriptional regulator [Mycoavidus cysteinexigens]GAM52517.1 secretion system regulator of DegU/UvrY/BvgA type [bacterium endosymbiont of Mortierella elongata FMR23-6]GLR01591.1 DNA-binding response regulator [Mycoavidus cysteinexigens]
MFFNNTTADVPRRILIVEDHSLLSDGIKNLLSTAAAYQVVGEVNNGLEAYRACQQWQPDIVLTDLGLPGMNGIDVIRQLKSRWPELVIIAVTADHAEHRAREALAAGALGYVLKQSPQQILLAALQTTLLGKPFLDPALSKALITEQPTVDGRTTLTPRESQILKLIAEGARNQDIADKLSITVKTVETHRLHLMRKLNAHRVADLVNWAIRLGIH